MYCNNCGNLIPDDSKFCPKCGEKTDSLTDLVNNMKNGTPEKKNAAFTELFNLSYKPVFGYIQMYTKDKDMTEDVLQSAYMACWTKIGQLNDPSSFTAWMKKIAFNKFVERARREDDVSLFAVIEDSDGNEMSSEESLRDDAVLLPEDAVADKELHRLLLDSINALPLMQGIAVRGFYFEGKTIADLALECGTPVNTVKSNLLRGRKALLKPVSKYANANGLKLVPLSIIPLMLLLSKEDAYACELMAGSGENVLQAIQSGASHANTSPASSIDVNDISKRVAAEITKLPVKTKIIAGIATIVVALLIASSLAGNKNKNVSFSDSYVPEESGEENSGSSNISDDALFDGVTVSFSGISGAGYAVIFVDGEAIRDSNYVREINGTEVDYWGENICYDPESVSMPYNGTSYTLAEGDTLELTASYWDSNHDPQEVTKEFPVSGLWKEPETIYDIPDKFAQDIFPLAKEKLIENTTKGIYSIADIKNIDAKVAGCSFWPSGTTFSNGEERVFIILEYTADMNYTEPLSGKSGSRQIKAYYNCYIPNVYVNDSGDYMILLDDHDKPVLSDLQSGVGKGWFYAGIHIDGEEGQGPDGTFLCQAPGFENPAICEKVLPGINLFGMERIDNGAAATNDKMDNITQ